MKNSQLLTELLCAARAIGNRKNPPVTAERYLIAVIDLLEGNFEKTEETDILGHIATSILVDFSVAKSKLLEYVCNSTSLLSDDLYMKKRIQEASKYTAANGETEVSAGGLLASILTAPSDAVKAVMREDVATEGNTAPQTRDEVLDKAIKDVENAVPVQSEEVATLTPKESMAEFVRDVKRVRTELLECIRGQDNAINVLTAGLFQSKMLSLTDKARKRPRATFLFAGPPGVGKTFLAEKAAEALGLPFARFDMSEYVNKEADLEFIGSDKVYKNGKPGNVTSFVAENPKCVLLFDEIEKAHLCVIHLFLQILDAGRLRDNYTDKVVSFTDTVIIMTTNAGRRLYEESESGDFSCVPRKVILKALQKDKNPSTGEPYFPGAICSRFASGNVVMFNHIGASDLREIAKNEILRHARSFEQESEIEFSVDESVYTALLFAEGGAADARTVRGRAESFFNDELYELFRLMMSEKVGLDITALEKIEVKVDLEGATPEIRELFASEENARVLLLSSTKVAEECKAQLGGKNIDIIAVQNAGDAIKAVRDKDISLAVLDMKYDVSEDGEESLNIEDVSSPAREFFKFLKEHGNSLPVYILEDKRAPLGEEEKVSLVRQGVRGEIPFAKKEACFASAVLEVAFRMHQQAGMERLARENKIISFETAQTVSRNRKKAEITLFDFELAVAVDAEDAKEILSVTSKPNVRFDDVIGGNDAKKELKYFVEYLRNPKKYMGSGVKAPKGILFYGPPGTGKTMLAKAMACESGVTFIATDGNSFLKSWVGEGSERVHDIFRTARKYAPSILFIDEIDAIAKERRGDTGGAEQTLTALLTEMDGFSTDPSKPVFVLAATNFDVEPGGPKSLDGALMRRFDRRVYIDLPRKEDRIRFMKMKIEKNKALQISEEQIENIAIRSSGMSLAALDSAIELALRSAIREGSTVVTDEIFEEAFETFNSGEVKKWNESELEKTAVHEAGHALLCWLSGETPSYLTIVARGNHGGYMQHGDHEGKGSYTKNELLSRIRTSLAGRAAEMVCYGEEDGVSTGASGDLANATVLAERIVCAYGMDKSFGLAVIDGMGSDLQTKVRGAVNSILDEQMEIATSLILENKDKLDALVKELVAKNHLREAEIRAVLEK